MEAEYVSCLDSQMADPDSQAPAKVSQKKRVSIVPPAGSPGPGLNGFAPSPDAELHTGEQGVQHAPERNHDRGLDSQDGPGGEGEEGAFTKPRPPQLELRRGADNKLIQNLKL